MRAHALQQDFLFGVAGLKKLNLGGYL